MEINIDRTLGITLAHAFFFTYRVVSVESEPGSSLFLDAQFKVFEESGKLRMAEPFRGNLSSPARKSATDISYDLPFAGIKERRTDPTAPAPTIM
jgi:hypothetical protein